MPLIHKREISPTATLGIWEVLETEAELTGSYPADHLELEKLKSFSHPFRRTQFLASRLLLHTLIPGSKIIYDENGKPFPDKKNMHISLSHSGKLIAMMIDENKCGIDIETIRPKIEKIAVRFLSDEELPFALQEPTIERLHVYWCVKEAIYKVNGEKNISLKTDIFVHQLNPTISGITSATLTKSGKSFSINVHYERFQDCMLAWTEQHGQ